MKSFDFILWKVLEISGLRSAPESELKKLIGKFSSSSEQFEQIDNKIFFGSIDHSMDALIMLNNRSLTQRIYIPEMIDFYRKTQYGTVKLLFSTDERDLSQPSPTAAASVMTNPNWLKDLTKNFNAEIVVPCSERTREAVTSNEDILVWI